MRRFLVAGVVLAAAVIIAAATGAFGSSSSHTSAAIHGSGVKAPMPVMGNGHAAKPAGAVRPVRMLHRSVVRVEIHNFKFAPARVVVSPGTRVVWVNRDSDPHTVTGDVAGGPLSSQALDTGQRYSTVLTKTGETPYHCTIHPYMHGAVVVS
jgi:plastocyanin